uniref:Gag-pol polyprotein n=1 Tax=Solanum tuberosum TaxID=4113 RepID=M1DVS3_SOLTU
MNPPMFFGSKVEEVPEGFIDEIIKVVDAMEVSPQEKTELPAYQLKDVVQVWYEKSKGERPVGVGPVDWELFKSVFLDRFFPLDLGNKRCKNSLTFAKEVHAEQIEGQKLKQVNREVKKARTDDGNSSKGKFESQSRPRFNRMFPTKDPLVLQGSTKIGCLTLNPKEVIDVVLMLISLIVQNVVRSMVGSA